MVDAFYADNGRIQVINNDDISFDSQRPSIELFTSLAITHSAYIDFPSYITSKAYYRDAVGGPTVCQLYATLIWQEWGPDESFNNERYQAIPGYPTTSPGPTSRNLPRQYLGSVPAETTHLDIRANLTRTVTPGNWFTGAPPVVSFPQGQWINLTGGSCPCETIQQSSRQFNVVRIGNDIYLERIQSTYNADTELAPGNNPQRNISVNESGWNTLRVEYLPSEGGIFAKSNWLISHKLDQRGPDTTGTKRPGSGSNECSGVAPSSQSVYQGTIVVTPGRHRT